MGSADALLLILWGVASVALLWFLVAGMLLRYHWRRYSFGETQVARVSSWFMRVGVTLSILALASLIAYTLSIIGI